MLKLDAVHAWYSKTEALFGVDLEVARGETLAIIGTNGAGKTTTLRAIAGSVPTMGSISIDGQEISQIPTHQRVRDHSLAIVHEGRGLLADLTVKENIVLGATRAQRRDLDDVLDLFPVLRSRTGEAASLLSGGQQQMVALARALLRQPAYLLLDEPALGLAPSVIDEIYQHISTLCNQGMGVVLVEQSVTRAAEVAHRMALIRVGKIVRTIDPSVPDEIEFFMEEAFGLSTEQQIQGEPLGKE